MSLELRQYIKEALAKGASKEQIAETLTQSGWALGIVQKTLEQFTGVDPFGVPIPAARLQAHQIARDFFVYLLTFVTLNLIAFAFGTLCFELIEHWFPDVDTIYYSSRIGSRSFQWGLAQLIVVVPAFFFLERFTQQALERYPEKRESFIRKFLIYLILGMTVLVALCDLIFAVNSFLQGELTIRFAARAGVILGIASLIFSYYFLEMQRDDRMVKGRKEVTATSDDAADPALEQKHAGQRYLGWFGLILILATIATTFFITGSPHTQRLRRIDNLRAENLETLKSTIEMKYLEDGNLPKTLDEVPNAKNLSSDPSLGLTYEYHKAGPETFQLCTTFDTDTSLDKTYRAFYQHPKGYHCFQLIYKRSKLNKDTAGQFEFQSRP